MSPAEFYTLIALAAEERHGYILIDRVNVLSGGRLNFATGSMYRTLRRLLDRALIVDVTDDRRPLTDDPRRRYYRITLEGRQALQDEVDRMREAIEVAAQAGFMIT